MIFPSRSKNIQITSGNAAPSLQPPYILISNKLSQAWTLPKLMSFRWITGSPIIRVPSLPVIWALLKMLGPPGSHGRWYNLPLTLNGQNILKPGNLLHRLTIFTSLLHVQLPSTGLHLTLTISNCPLEQHQSVLLRLHHQLLVPALLLLSHQWCRHLRH